MNKYKIVFTRRAIKDFKELNKKEKDKLKIFLSDIISINPFFGEKLSADLKGNYSYRLNIRDRIVYSIDKENKKVYIKRVRTHYGD